MAAIVGISIGCVVFALLILIGIWKGIKHCRNTGPRPFPVRTFFTQKNAAPESTDHEMSHGNQGHDYEDPRDLVIPSGPPSYNEVLQQQNSSYTPPLPPIPEPTGPTKAQPVIPRKNTVRKQSGNKPPPVPMTRRPSGAIEPPELPQQDVRPAKDKIRKFSLDSSVFRMSNESPPPPIVPRERGLSQISSALAHVPELSTASLPQQTNKAEESVYSNLMSTAKETPEIREEESEFEDTNADLGYVECIHVQNTAEGSQAIYVKNSKL